MYILWWFMAGDLMISLTAVCTSVIFFSGSAGCRPPRTLITIDIYSAILETSELLVHLCAIHALLSIHFLQFCIGLWAGIAMTTSFVMVYEMIIHVTHLPSKQCCKRWKWTRTLKLSVQPSWRSISAKWLRSACFRSATMTTFQILKV